MPSKPPAHDAHRKKAPRIQFKRKEKLNDDPRFKAARKFRSSRIWRNLRDRFIREYPFCSDPYKDHEMKNRTILADQVHHIFPLIDYPEFGDDPENLASICTGCHARLEATERGGNTTHHLFNMRLPKRLL